MILHRGIVPSTFLALVVAGCIPSSTRHLLVDGAAGGSGGTGAEVDSGSSSSGGSSGSGGGVGDGGSGGSGGSAEGTGGSGGSGGSVDAGKPADGGAAVDSGASADAGVKLDDINLYVLANCVFCHPGMAQKQSNFDPSDKGLYDRLLTTMDKAIPAACPIKTLIAPGKPEMSLIYLKVTGTQPAACGMKMPLAPDMKKPGTPLDPSSIKVLKDWITAGAPQ